MNNNDVNNQNFGTPLPTQPVNMGPVPTPVSNQPMNFGPASMPEANQPINLGAAPMPEASQPMNFGPAPVPEASQPAATPGTIPVSSPVPTGSNNPLPPVMPVPPQVNPINTGAPVPMQNNQSELPTNNLNMPNPVLPTQPVQPNEINNASANNGPIQSIIPTTDSNNMGGPIAPVPEMNVANPVNSDDDELLRAFIGPNYEKITTRPFNFAGLFFSGFYLFYRKMIGYGLLLAFITGIFMTLIRVEDPMINYGISLGIALAVGAIVGMFVNKLYVNKAKKKISKIKAKNSEKNIEELKSICASKGGRSFGFILLGILALILVAVIIVVALFFLGFASIIGSFIPILNNTAKEVKNDLDYNNYQNEAKSGDYNGLLIYDLTIDMSDEFTITVPDKFEDVSSDGTYEYQYSGTEGIFNECKASLSVPDGYNDAESLINSMHKYNIDDTPTDVENETINNINWYHFSYEDSFGKTHYYGTTKNNKVFLFKYEINKDADSDCSGYLDPIINSIQSK